MSGHYNCQNGLLRLSCFPESVGLNDHYEGPQIQLKVITGATSSQTNNRVRPRQSFVIFSNPDDQTTVRSPSDHHPGSRSLRYLAHWFQSALITSGWIFRGFSFFHIFQWFVCDLLSWTNQVFYIQDFSIEIPQTSHCRLLVSRPRAIKPRIRWVDYVSICRIFAIIGSWTIYLVNGDWWGWPRPWYDAPISRSRHSCPDMS